MSTDRPGDGPTVGPTFSINAERERRGEHADQLPPVPVPTPEDRIGGWLPPHTHRARTGGGFLAPEATTVWTWTTTAGTWRVTLVRPLFGVASLELVGPGGGLRIGAPDPAGLRRLQAVLIALDAITPPAAGEPGPASEVGIARRYLVRLARFYASTLEDPHARAWPVGEEPFALGDVRHAIALCSAEDARDG